MMLVPRKISDHIPTVPINSTDRFLTIEWNENLGKNHYLCEMLLNYIFLGAFFVDKMHRKLRNLI